MAEVRSWIHTWQRFVNSADEATKQQLLQPIKGNDSVVNELLAKELYTNHLTTFTSLYIHTNQFIQLATLEIAQSLCQSASPFCRRLAALSIPYLLLLEWINANKDCHGMAVKALQTIFIKQEMAVHPIPPTIRYAPNTTVSDLSKTKEYPFHAAYYEVDAEEWSEITRLPMTIRLCQLFIDYSGDAPKSIILVFCLLWISLLSSNFKSNELILSEMADTFDDRQCEFFLQNINSDREYPAFNEDMSMLLLEWTAFSTDRTPTSSKVLMNLVSDRVKKNAYASALLYLYCS